MDNKNQSAVQLWLSCFYHWAINGICYSLLIGVMDIASLLIGFTDSGEFTFLRLVKYLTFAPLMGIAIGSLRFLAITLERNNLSIIVVFFENILSILGLVFLCVGCFVLLPRLFGFTYTFSLFLAAGLFLTGVAFLITEGNQLGQAENNVEPPKKRGQAVRNLQLKNDYAALLASAAWAGGSLSPKSKSVIAAVLEKLHSHSTDLPISNEARVEISSLVDANLSNPVSAAAAARLATDLGLSDQDLARDLCAVLSVDGELSQSSLRWLETFDNACQFNVGQYVSFFVRDSSSITENRTRWLDELELHHSATDEEIRAAYRKLAQKYHPDTFKDLPPQAAELVKLKMASINAAYQSLKLELAQPELIFCKPEAADRTKDLTFYPTPNSSFECLCWLCAQKLKVPASAEPATIRCPKCNAFAGLTWNPLSDG